MNFTVPPVVVLNRWLRNPDGMVLLNAWIVLIALSKALPEPEN
jgi:hypothetical protein